MMELGVCHSGIYVMDVKTVLIGLMKQIAVREMKFACKRKAVNFIIIYFTFL